MIPSECPIKAADIERDGPYCLLCGGAHDEHSDSEDDS